MRKLIKSWCERIMDSRPPDVVIGSVDHPYLLRWWVWKRNKFFNLYLHKVLRSDDDRALHDHPWWNLSYIVDGGYMEESFARPWQYGSLPYRRRNYRAPGTFKLRKPTDLHRLETIKTSTLSNGRFVYDVVPCITLFLTGPRLRTWGFQCAKGWVNWKDFTQTGPDGEYLSKGCGEMDPQYLRPKQPKAGWLPLQG